MQLFHIFLPFHRNDMKIISGIIKYINQKFFYLNIISQYFVFVLMFCPLEDR